MAAAPEQARRMLALVADEGAQTVRRLIGSLDGSADQVRDALLTAVPEVVSYYSDGSAALAADWYDDLREKAAVPGRFRAEPFVKVREEYLQRTVVWAVGPLFQAEPDREQVALRLLPDVQKEVARPFRDTVTTNSRRDRASVGWRRVSSGAGCNFCKLLSGRGAVYRESTARFAAHGNCHCSAEPVFNDGRPHESADVMQYVASKRHRTEAERAALREYLKSIP